MTVEVESLPLMARRLSIRYTRIRRYDIRTIMELKRRLTDNVSVLTHGQVLYVLIRRACGKPGPE